MIKILNCYCGIGGNRKYWPSEKIHVTAIENNSDIAAVYKDFFPQDKVIITDAHQYLLDNFKEYDFIWSSPPCQTHSSFRQNICVRFRNTAIEYPDMRLYQEIIMLQKNAKTKWVVENVKPYYEPLIKGKLIQRHLFWSNFDISEINIKHDKIRTAQIPDLQKKHGFNLDKYKLKNKRQILRNCVLPELGLHVFKNAFGEMQ